ncbi:uncharacterized protein CLUP02_16274 [Colletotrichum lupini]|uniref:Uncharacterized protein n=1 Tax=Colletotrichum lupini TaxID=145971 RepID=A0A9Q8WPB6_9PEZI|nr:uncharacterized protein CLUP02_16274 [Colletotrichum lupini]UQC90744.1 hypothetical protein CLUP02_16274 [Colletotrichum lupini]
MHCANGASFHLSLSSSPSPPFAYHIALPIFAGCFLGSATQLIRDFVLTASHLSSPMFRSQCRCRTTARTPPGWLKVGVPGTDGVWIFPAKPSGSPFKPLSVTDTATRPTRWEHNHDSTWSLSEIPPPFSLPSRTESKEEPFLCSANLRFLLFRFSTGAVLTAEASGQVAILNAS